MTYVSKLLVAGSMLFALAAPVFAQENENVDVRGLTCADFEKLSSEDMITAIPILRLRPDNAALGAKELPAVGDTAMENAALDATEPQTTGSELTNEEVMAVAVANCEGHPEMSMAEAILPKI